MPRFYKVTSSGLRHREGMTLKDAEALAEVLQRKSPPGDRVVAEVVRDREAEREFDEAWRDSKR